MNRDLTGQVAIVTGAARGIGKAIAVALAARGAKVFVNTPIPQISGADTITACREAGGDGEEIVFDVSNSAAVDAGFEAVREKAGRIDILVNNAGISLDGLLIRFKDEDWKRTLSVNLDGAFYCVRAASKIMMKARYGRIVNIASIVGQMGNAGQIAYVSSKAALIGLTKTVAREMASRNITVNAVAPGFIETDMTAALDTKVRDEHLKVIPLGRYGQAAEVATLVSFLAGPDSGYITGQVIGINGGMYM